MKTCSVCKILKPIDQFSAMKSAKDGKQYRCKECHVEVNRAWSNRNKEKKKQYNRTQYLKYAEQGGRPSQKSSFEKRQARKKIWDAVKRGDVHMSTACEDCGRDNDKLQAHHCDYSKPLDVRWLCAPCHGLLHAKERKQAKYGVTPEGIGEAA